MSRHKIAAMIAKALKEEIEPKCSFLLPDKNPIGYKLEQTTYSSVILASNWRASNWETSGAKPAMTIANKKQWYYSYELIKQSWT